MQESLTGSGVERAAGAVWLNCRGAWRSLHGSPGFTATALILLAFGIGLNTAVFTVINAVLFRSLAVTAPHELAFVSRSDPRGNEWNLGAYEDVQRFAANADLFTGGAGVELDTASARIGDDVEGLTGERVSANYFEVLGVAPVLGRTLVSSLDGVPGAERVVVLSDALWRRRFHADPAVIGRSIALGAPLFLSEYAPRYTVVGVVGPEFAGVSSPWAPSEYWVEFTRREDDVFGVLKNRTPKIGMVVARMQPGVTLDRVRAFADASLSSVTDLVVRPDPAKSGPGGPDVSASPRAKLPFGGGAIAPSRLSVGLLLVAGLVLAIAAANLAGLVMARRLAQRRDVAIRLCLGAVRGQIARQLMTETLFLALAGGIIGLALSRVLVTKLLADMGRGFGGSYARVASLGVPVDRRVIAFTTLICVATGPAVGLASVRRMRTANALIVTAGESLGAPTAGRWRRRHWILVPQLTLSIALVLVALVAVRALVNVALVTPGYEPDRAAYVTFERLLNQSYSAMSPAQKAAYQQRVATFPRRLLEAAEMVPGIEVAAIANALPTRPRRADVIPREGPARGRRLHTEAALVTSGYFRAMGIPLLQGRVFDPVEIANGHPVAVVDEELARRLWPGERAVGQSFASYSGGLVSTLRSYEVVGVVGAVRGPLSEGDSYAFAYLPWPQEPPPDPILIGRGRVTGQQILTSLRDVAKQADADIGVLQTRMISRLFDDSRYPRRLAAKLLGFCALGGLLLAASGLYGVLSYAVAQRRREIGIRAALGARHRHLVLLVVKEGAAVAGIGSIIGIPLAWIALRITSHYLVPMPALDILTLGFAPLAVSVVALAACYFPARRAAGVDPIVVLRAL
jgi:predicted permease